MAIEPHRRRASGLARMSLREPVVTGPERATEAAVQRPTTAVTWWPVPPAVQRWAGALLTVTGARDPDIERRASLLLWSAAILELLLGVAAATLQPSAGNARVWLATVPIGMPILFVSLLLARRAHADAAALLFTGAVIWVLAMFAWIEGPGCNRMTAAILGVVAMGAVLSTRLTALVGAGLAAMIAALSAAEAAGIYQPYKHAGAAEAVHAPFIRQVLFIALMVVLLRRGYDRLLAQVRDRERAGAAAVDAARAINSSLEARVAERTSTLAATRDQLGGLAGRLARDLGANLGTMRGQLEAFAAAEAGLGARALRSIAKASTAIERLSLMTDRLHDFACIGATALRPELVAMDALVRDVIDDFDRGARGAGIEWHVDQLPAAWADPAVVRVVVENLISNAIKFSRQRQPPRIQIGHDNVRGYFVQDNGVGFDPRLAGELFMPFRRLHAGTEFEGHGVGLANVRQMVERSGGAVCADSQLHHGATFYVRLPPGPDPA
jgi:signal transduction histidine kinase